jgi:hypothetical protein
MTVPNVSLTIPGMPTLPGSTAPNPLIAPKQDTSTWHTGINLLDDAAGIHDGIASGSWLATGLSVAGTGMDAMTMVLNPVATVVSYGLNFLIERVKPLQDALNWLAGDAAQVSAYGGTWQNVSQSTQQAATSFATSLTKDTANWTGATADTYRADAKTKIDALNAAATASNTVGSATQLIGSVVNTVRGMIRDLVTQAVGQVVQTALRALLIVTIPVVAYQAASQIATWMRKIADTVKQLTSSLAKLQPLMTHLQQLWTSIKQALSGTARTAETVAADATHGIDLPTTVPILSKDAAFAQHEAEQAAADQAARKALLDKYKLTNERGLAYRKGLQDTYGPPPADGSTYVAHHTLPVKNHADFERAGIDTTNPAYGAWVEEGQHRAFSAEYESSWDTFFQNNPQAGRSQVVDFAREQGQRYGYQTPF